MPSQAAPSQNVPAQFVHPQDREQVTRLQYYAKGVVDGLNVGKHRSPHKGFSAQFKEHRPYVLGDEIRSIDWKLYGKTDRLFIRQYEEETNLRCTILLDQSRSMAYAGQSAIAFAKKNYSNGGSAGDSQYPGSKLAYASRLAACIAYLLIAQQDAVGLAMIDSELHDFIPARARPSHLQALLTLLANATPRGETSLGEVIQKSAPQLKGRGLVVLISDCFDDIDRLLTALQFLRLSRNEVILFQVWDRDELEFPFHQRTEFKNLESPDHKQTADPISIRKAYLDRVQKFQKQLTEGCSKYRIDYVPCISDQPHGEILSSYIASRGRQA